MPFVPSLSLSPPLPPPPRPFFFYRFAYRILCDAPEDPNLASFDSVIISLSRLVEFKMTCLLLFLILPSSLSLPLLSYGLLPREKDDHPLPPLSVSLFCIAF